MQNFVQTGDVLEFAAPSGGVTAGTPVQIGSIVVVPLVTVAQTIRFNGIIRGVVGPVAKTTGAAWTEGELIYWDAETSTFTDVAGDNHLAGFAARAAGSSDATGYVYLDGVPRADETT